MMMLPPGLSLPPGLEMPSPRLAPPPGFEDTAGDIKNAVGDTESGPSPLSPMYVPGYPVAPVQSEATVWIYNLPSNLCQDVVLEATLQQAQLDKFVSNFVTKSGSPCGEAHVNFTNRDAALRCTRHFDGRRWGGFEVSAQLSEKSKKSTGAKSKLSSKNLSADAPVFVPSFSLSAQAPEFTPMPGMMSSLMTMVTADSAPLKVSCLFESDVSTDDGASVRSEDDKELDRTTSQDSKVTYAFV